MDFALNDEQLQQLIERSLVKVLTERKDLLQSAMTEVFEDLAMGRAVEEATQQQFVELKMVKDYLSAD